MLLPGGSATADAVSDSMRNQIQKHQKYDKDETELGNYEKQLDLLK
jgi:hypothetical protein